MHIPVKRSINKPMLVLATLALAGSLSACGNTADKSTDAVHSAHTHTTVSQQSTQLPVQAQINDCTLENADKQQVSLAKDLKAKAKLVYFFYTSCGDVCPITTRRMESILLKLKQQVPDADVKMVSITIDPERDTEEVLRQYAKQFKVDSNTWAFLRGSKEQTDALMKQFQVSADPMPNHQFMHSDRLFLLDEKDQWRTSYVMGTDVKDEDVVADIKQLLGK